MGRRIVYPGVRAEESITAEFLTSEQAHLAVGGLLDVIKAGYIEQLSRAPANVPVQTIHNRYGSRFLENVDRYRDRTNTHYRLGSEVVVVHGRLHPYRAFAKTTPARKIRQEPYAGCYVNDIIARPPHHSGAGSLALHAALKFGKHNLSDAVLLDGFKNSPVNKWYEKLGLVADLSVEVGDFYLSQKQQLPMVFYHTPPEVTLGTVISVLEAEHPNLAEGVPVV